MKYKLVDVIQRNMIEHTNVYLTYLSLIYNYIVNCSATPSYACYVYIEHWYNPVFLPIGLCYPTLAICSAYFICVAYL